MTKKYIQKDCVQISDRSMKPFLRYRVHRLQKHGFEKNAFKVFKVQSSKPRRLYKYACNSENIGQIDLKFCVYTFELIYIAKIKLKKNQLFQNPD